MRYRRTKKSVLDCPIIREVLWKELYVSLGINVMITNLTNVNDLDKTKRKLEQMAEFETFIESYDYEDDDYY